MPDKEEERLLAKARKLIRIQSTSRFNDDMYYQLAVLKRYNEIPEYLRQMAERAALGDPALEAEPVRRGRRLDLEAETLTRPQRSPHEGPPLVVKVLIAGSGYNGWKTHVDSGTGAVLEWERADDLQNKKEVVHHARDRGKGPELMVAGPGAADSKDRSVFGGGSDTGSNSIAELVAQVPGLVARTITEGLAGGERPIVILIKAHSRGAVAASQVAEKIRADHPTASVELVQVDPVPGPGHKGKDVEIKLPGAGDPGGIDESTLVYSVASGYPVGFTPQKVHGARRIIVSRQNHSAGLDNGFIYAGELYKGSSLNSLAAGVYVDNNADGKNDVPLVRVADINEARVAIDEAFKASSAYSRDYGRMDIIGEILAEFLERA